MNTALWVLVGVIVGGMLLRMPIGFSMIASGIAYLLVTRQDMGLVTEQIGNGLYNSYVLLAVPMFVFAANLMNAGTVSERLFDFCRILVGRLRGGLALAAIPASWDYVRFMGREGTPVLGVPFSWVFLPFVILLAALVVRCAWAIWDALRGRHLESELRL